MVGSLGCNLEGALLLSNNSYTNYASLSFLPAKCKAVLGVGAGPSVNGGVRVMIWLRLRGRAPAQ